jgi:bifunctional NMN adenylyltransferase/nudix hydrolase
MINYAYTHTTPNVPRESLGVIIGRFQVPYLHAGHKHLLSYVMSRNSHVLLLIGDSPVRDIRNPLDFETRVKMFSRYQRNPTQTFRIDRLEDRPGNDVRWSNEVDFIINVNKLYGIRILDVTIYGSRDSFIPHYKGHFKVEEVPADSTAPSGTELRAACHLPSHTSEFRRGVIYTITKLFNGNN